MKLFEGFKISPKTEKSLTQYVNHIKKYSEETNDSTDLAIKYIVNYIQDFNKFLGDNHGVSITRDIFRSHYDLAWILFNKTGFSFTHFLEKYCPDVVDSKKKKVGGTSYDDSREDIVRKADLAHNIVTNTKKKKRFFITSATPGFDIHKKFLNTIKQYCKEQNATLIILPTPGKRADAFWIKEEYALIEDYLTAEYNFNSNLKAMDIGISPTMMIPLTGLDRLGQKEYSLIVSSTKQQMNVIPISTIAIPHILHSTGTISTNDSYNRLRTGRLAEQDHILGGLIVEVDSELFHIRQIQADLENGSFIDLKLRYTEKGSEDVRPVALYLGDSHAGWEDEVALRETFNQIEYLNPSQIFIGDLFDGTSISHHTKDNIIALATLPSHINTLEKELHVASQYLLKIRTKFPNLIINIVRANHDEHLDRYLSDGRYVKDSQNHRIALELALYLIDGKNPLEEWVKKNYPNLTKNINWLTRTSSIKISGVELALHGDKGVNGSKSSVYGLERSYANCIVGHRHSPGIFRNVYTVGTLSKYNLPYTIGNPSSWLHTNCSIYETGNRQLLNIIMGKWRL